MPEFRQNFASKEWVIIATERAKRPDNFKKNMERRPELPPHVKDCPFCAGNESLTPEPNLVIRRDAGWRVRVVPNKYAAVSGDLDKCIYRHREGLFMSAAGFGIAEVVIETPDHSKTLALLSREEIVDVLLAYHNRYNTIALDPRVAMINIFRNNGPRAGTSLEHPHSQIIATPIVAPHVRDPIVKLMRAYDTYGTCIYCDMLIAELKDGSRIIHESDHFAVISPYAARSPFETRIYPKRHDASFGNIGDNEIDDLAESLRIALKKLYVGLDNPDYNFVIQTAPLEHRDSRFMHWQIIVAPKLTTPAGFEMGTGIYINVTLPEECAEFLRGIDV